MRNAYFDTHPTAAELAAVLGEGWAICRATPKNRERYTRCISPKAYREAEGEAMRRRVKLQELAAPIP